MAVDRKAITQPIGFSRGFEGRQVMEEPRSRTPTPVKGAKIDAFVMSTSIGKVGARVLREEGPLRKVEFAGIVVRSLDNGEECDADHMLQVNDQRYEVRQATLEETQILRKELLDLGKLWFMDAGKADPEES